MFKFTLCSLHGLNDLILFFFSISEKLCVFLVHINKTFGKTFKSNIKYKMKTCQC